MEKIVIKSALIDGQEKDVLIEKGHISKIESSLSTGKEDKVIDGRGCALIPSFVNGHTHSPMTLIRGAADDMELKPWLEDRIWPLEAQFSDEDYYWGNRLAFLEMIKGGTTFFNEMYFKPGIALKALKGLPLKGLVSFTFIDGHSEEKSDELIKECTHFLQSAKAPKGVELGIAVHAIYTNTQKTFEWARDYSKEHNLKIHVHLSETALEVENCKKDHNGMTPVEYLDSINFLSDRVYAAHCVHLTDSDMDILKKRGVTVLHCPASNMKLSSGVFPFKSLKEKGIPVVLGTDGVASNNNLSMFDEMKLASLLQKVHHLDPTRLNASDTLNMASKQGIDAFKTQGGLRVGASADLMLIDLEAPHLKPLWNLDSQLVYAANSSDVKTLISQGEILMENRFIPWEQECLKAVELCAKRLKKL